MKYLNELSFALVGLLLMVVFFAGFAGWVFNLHAIFTGFDAMQTNEQIIRIIGIFIAPIGAVVGWL